MTFSQNQLYFQLSGTRGKIPQLKLNSLISLEHSIVRTEVF